VLRRKLVGHPRDLSGTHYGPCSCLRGRYFFPRPPAHHPMGFFIINFLLLSHYDNSGHRNFV
jgi:hypothetical protein